MKKHLGKILLIVVPIVAAFLLLYPTYQAAQLEGKEKEAIERAKLAKNSVDSLKIMEDFKKQYGEALKEAKQKRLKLGLDLRGGMYVTMEVDVVKLIEETATDETVDETFRDVIAKTNQEAKSSDEDAMKIFQRNFEAIARPQGKSLLNYFDIGNSKEISEEKIIEKLNNDIANAIDQAQEVIRQRIDKYGVSEPNLQKQGSRRIMLELPGVQNQDEMRSLLSTTARLEFKLVRNNADIAKAFAKIDKYLSDKIKSGKSMFDADPLANLAPVADTTKVAQDTTKKAETAKADTTKVAQDTTKKDSTKNPNDPYAGLSKEAASKKFVMDHPFTTMFMTMYSSRDGRNAQQFAYIGDVFPDGEYMFQIMKDSIDKFKLILSRPEIAAMIPGDLEIAIEAKPDERVLRNNNMEIFTFHALKKEAELKGDVVSNAQETFDQTSNAPVVMMEMNLDGAEAWARITGANIKKRIAIVLDGRVYSAPTVQNKITGGNSQITGMANIEEAKLLRIVLKAGALKAPVQIIEERVVGPSLGEDSINAGLSATAVAFILVILFMMLYYHLGGVLANLAVIINVLMILGVMASMGGTLTLPGIAGIILTVGMAVDANVLIFERIREELHHGRSLRASIDVGFRQALNAIIDSNVTTFITGAILYFLGSGPIQGFAVTLMIGIIFTLFTAITVTKAMIEIILSNGGTSFDFGQPKFEKN